MSQWDAPWQEAGTHPDESISTLSPASAVSSPAPSSDGYDPFIPGPPPHNDTAASRVPALALPNTVPVAQRTDPLGRTKIAAATSPDTPELAEAGPSAPAHAFRKPPRPSSRQTKQYTRSHLGEPDHVPVNWIGDSTDHTGYRPSNTASFSNHEPDIVRVATFSTQGQKPADNMIDERRQSLSCTPSRRRWPIWVLLGVVAGTALGVAYKMAGGEGIDSRIEATRQHCAAALSRRKSQVSQPSFCNPPHAPYISCLRLACCRACMDALLTYQLQAL